MALQKLGPFDLIEVLGRGGMGTVYRAVDSTTGRVVAVKALAPALSQDEHFRARFESEIHTMIKMDHPNVVRLLNYGQYDGNLFFGMELVEGSSLFTLQKSGVEFDWRQVLRITLDVCAGLQHAHNRGIIHRDLKPGNLIREKSGNVKITDFGIAKTFGASHLTGEGSVLGTMDFMSPEQAKSDKVTIRSDLYSLGALMYMLLARRPPLKSDSLEATIKNLTSVKPVPIQSLVPSVPDDFARVIHRLLEKDPSKRFPTALSLSKHLLELQTQLKVSAEAKTESTTSLGAENTDTSIPADDASATRVSTSSVPDSESFEVRRTAVEDGLTVNEDEASGKEETASGDSNLAAKTVVQEDFFSEVTSQDRERQFAPQPPTKPTGIWPVALAFAAVIGLLGIGLYYGVFRQPSADQLLSEIDASAGDPQAVHEQIEQFVNLYPKHERISEILTLRQLENAIRLRKQLALRVRLRGPTAVSSLERQFLDLTDFDSPTDYTKLGAMITLYEADNALDAESREIIDAAKSYRFKFLQDVARQTAVDRTRIEQAIQSAAEADADSAQAIYKSIIEIYADKSWAADLVKMARERLK